MNKGAYKDQNEYEQSLIALRLAYTTQRGLLICVLKFSAYGLYEKNRLSAVGLNIEVGFAHMHSQEKCIWVNMKLEP